MLSTKAALWFLLVGLVHHEVANSKIVFNEIMIDTEKDQWIELYNTENRRVSLLEWKLYRRVGDWVSTFEIPQFVALGPYGYLKPFTTVEYNAVGLMPKGANYFEEFVSWWDNEDPESLQFTTPGASLARNSPLFRPDDASNWAHSTSFINCNSTLDKGTPKKINTYVCPTRSPTGYPTTSSPTSPPSTGLPTESPTDEPTTLAPTNAPTTLAPINAPTTLALTSLPTSRAPTSPLTKSPTTPTTDPPTGFPTDAPTTDEPTTHVPTLAPSTLFPTNAPSYDPTANSIADNARYPRAPSPFRSVVISDGKTAAAVLHTSLILLSLSRLERERAFSAHYNQVTPCVF